MNKVYRRSGTLLEGRYKSCPIQAETYLLACQLYIELNPVRAAMVRHPAKYKWSSYAANAQGDINLITQTHGVYMAIGLNDSSRLEAYRELFRYSLEIGVVDEIRKATNGNYVLGSSKFAEQIAKALGRRVIAGKSGRPKLKPAKVL